MLGFLADYWKLKVAIKDDGKRKVLSYFIKAISRSNSSKADMVKEMNLFDKELQFYSVIKEVLDIPGLKPWSAKYVTALNDAIVFEDLNDLQYKLRNKHDRFDMAHTLQALRTLANFHAASIIFEENKKKELQTYTICDQFKDLADPGGYRDADPWFTQCKKGALEAIKIFSVYSKDNHTIKMIESRWDDVWKSALDLGNVSSKHRNVICHRDLWNNNILFHYKKIDDTADQEPDDCLLVDFQATCIQPLVADVMLLLYCNLEPKFREENMTMFLNYYHQELRMVLCGFGVSIDQVLVKEEFFASAEQYRLWGLVLCACLIPQFWVDDELTTHIFGDSASFVEIMVKDKATFIKKMMQANPHYKKNVMAIFDEIVQRYCI
ncbi:ecdysteroid kinase domain-containing protein [Phthorimaea operculella]|nr:ecdysteroid kinase domain-containing protein [Phthorimaea operculella]